MIDKEKLMAGKYKDAYDMSINNPGEFWGEAAEEISWFKPFDRVLDNSDAPFYRWFPGGELNTCYNAIDRHVERGRGNQNAIIYDSPVTDMIENITYGDLLDRVAKLAGLFLSLGVKKGDTVIIYMPMIPQALISMLACARIGAVHSVVFGGFASNELAIRIDDAKPKLIVSSSCGIEGKKIIEYKPLLDKAIEISEHKPEKCIIFQRKQATCTLKNGRDINWINAVNTATPAEPLSVKATDPLYILYTSGTTGMPKGVVRDNGGHAVALLWSMKYIYGIKPGDIWLMGHRHINSSTK
jgi:propionyl-CoA synthetase